MIHEIIDSQPPTTTLLCVTVTIVLKECLLGNLLCRRLRNGWVLLSSTQWELYVLPSPSAPSTDAQLQFSCPGLSLPFCRHCCSQQLVQHQLMPTGHSECGCKLFVCLLWCLYLALKASDDLKSSSFACLFLPSAQPAFHSKYNGYYFGRTALHSVHILGLFRIAMFCLFVCF